MMASMTSLQRWMKGVMLKSFPLMITCEEFEGFLFDYLEGSLPARQRRVFELHLKICRECRDYLAAYKRTLEVGKQVYAEPLRPVHDEVPEDLLKAVLDARRS